MAGVRPELLIVDLPKCAEVAALLREQTVPPAAEDNTCPLGLPADQLPNFYFFAVAICHQTSPVGQPRLGGRLRAGDVASGWDYLRRRFAERACDDASLLDPHRWQRLGARELVELLAGENAGVHLTDPERRAALIRDAGRRMIAKGWQDVADIHATEHGWLLQDDRGILRRLAEFESYRDPVRKKSYLLLALLQHECAWSYRDPANLRAPVDYHEVRGHLRLGTVRVLDLALSRQLESGARVSPDADVAIRTAVADAIDAIAAMLPPTDASALHYLFWNIFRSCCARDFTHCGACGAGCTLAGRYRLGGGECLFAGACASRGAPRWLEHQHETDFY